MMTVFKVNRLILMTPLKIPYGLADFQRLRREGFFYQDRTDRIGQLEAAGHQLVFLRPRRFGKSLLLSMLENYYDVNKADSFGELFGDLAVGRNPTPLRNRFFILKWDFSRIAAYGDLDAIQSAIHGHLNLAIADCAERYQLDVKLNEDDALYSFGRLLQAVNKTQRPLYLLIDEYDNFANEVMMRNNSHYGALLQGEGLLKTVFKNIKSAAGGLGLERVFITGVSPVVMSDMTSGYNVAINIYFDPEFNDLCGFTEPEVEGLVVQCLPQSACEAEFEDAMSTLRTFYNGYRFSEHAESGIYNPTLTLYFCRHLQRQRRFPNNLLDENLAMDRNKLQYLAGLPHGEDIIVKALGGDEPLAVEQLSERFGVEDMIHGVKDQTFMLSLLYYFGMLTLSSDISGLGKQLLTIPNLVARKLYIERLRECLLRPDFDAREDIDRAVERFISAGDLQLLCDFIEQRYFTILSNRDYRWSNELTIKVAFMTLLYNDHLYMMVSETETRRRYADLSLIVRPDMRRFQALDLVLEFKYVKLAETGLTAEQVRASTTELLAGLSKVSDRLAEAESQAREYMHDLQQRYPEAQLHGFAVVAIGFERLLWRKVAATQISNN